VLLRKGMSGVIDEQPTEASDLQAGGAIQQHQQEAGDPAGRDPVPGVVRLMTEEPLEMPSPTLLDGIRERVAETLNRRPWLVPACLLGAGGVFLLLRRRA
jgi:hypothetical protein